MPSLYVANTSKQHHQFVFRMPEVNGVSKADIPIGAQVIVGERNMSLEQINAIVDQHKPYGLTHVSELPRRKKFIGLCYSIDKPVTFDSIAETIERNDGALNERAEERREETVASIAQELQGVTGGAMKRAEVELVEDGDVRNPGSNSMPNIAAGFEVVSEGVQPRHAGKRGRRAR